MSNLSSAETFAIAHPVPRRGRMPRTRRIRDDWGAGLSSVPIPRMAETPREVMRKGDAAVFAAEGRAWIPAEIDASGRVANLKEVADLLRDPETARNGRTHGFHGYLHRSPIRLPTGSPSPRGDAKPTPPGFELLWSDPVRAERKLKGFVADRFRLDGDRLYRRYERLPLTATSIGSRAVFLDNPRNLLILGVPLLPDDRPEEIPTNPDWREHRKIPTELLPVGDGSAWAGNLLPGMAIERLRLEGLGRHGFEDLAERAGTLVPRLEPFARDGMAFYLDEPEELLASLMVVGEAAEVIADVYRRMDPGERTDPSRQIARKLACWEEIERYVRGFAMPQVMDGMAPNADAGELAGFAP